MKTRLIFAIALTLGFSPAAHAAPLAAIRLEVDDLSNNPISSIPVGSSFLLKLYAQDVRDPQAAFPGVFAAFTDVSYAPNLVSVNGTEILAPLFNLLGPQTSIVPGGINGVGGATSSGLPTGPNELWIASVPMHADSAGSLFFTALFDPTSGHEVLLFGIDDAINPSQIQFTGVGLSITPEPSSLVLAAICAVSVAGWQLRRRTKRQ